MKFKIIIVFLFILLKISSYANSNYCVDFHDNYAIFPTDVRLRPRQQITIECWIKVDKYYNWGAPISYLVDNLYEESGYAFAFNEGKMRFMIKTDKMHSQDWTFNPGAKIELNQWYHIAGVYDGKSIKFFLNGKLSEEKYVSGNIDWSFIPSQMGIGAFIDNNELHYFNGSIDEVRIWNRGLTVDEIVEGMTRGLTGEEDGLIAYYPMDEQGAIIEDRSINNFDGNILNYTAENRIPSLSMVRPVINNTELLSTSSYKIEWTIPNYSNPLKTYVIDVASDSKFNSILPGFNNLKTIENNFIFENIPGGENLYVRIKGLTLQGEYTAFSSPYLVNEFSSSLTIDLLSKGAGENFHFLILDKNILTTDNFKFPKGTQSIVLESRLTSKQPFQDSYANLNIEGPDLNNAYNLSKVSNLIFSGIEPGKYKVDLSWGPQNKEELKNSFTIEIGRTWWQSLWFRALLILFLFGAGYLFYRYFVILGRSKYIELKDGFMPIPEKEDALSDEEIDRYYAVLIQLMESEKPYLEPRLNIKMLGDMVDVSPETLSKVIHEKFGYYFNDFVNKYRIEEVKKQLQNVENSKLKISTIAFNCGFNSESTFFRVFKKFTGETPNSYQRKNRNKK